MLKSSSTKRLQPTFFSYLILLTVNFKRLFCADISKIKNLMKVHFISIGGSVMHQLAIALKRKGYEVTGSDDEIFEPSKTNLQAEGILPKEIGWKVENIHP